jgi:hypothetical protein
MSEIARVLGKTEDHSFYRDRSAKVKIAFNKAFLDSTRGIYTDGVSTDHASLHANMFPLAFHLVPDDYKAGVAQYIKGKGMACSVYGSQYLLEGLYEAGEAQHAFDLITSDSKRSWLNMLRVGSTMTTEAWDEYFKPNLTWNHAWGAAPANIIPRKLFGIEPLEPAFEKIRIRPQPADLEMVEIKKPTIKGPVHGKWLLRDNYFTLTITIPANTEAEIWLPTSDPAEVTGNGNPIQESQDISLLESETEKVVCAVKAGTYVFRAPYNLK